MNTTYGHLPEHKNFQAFLIVPNEMIKEVKNYLSIVFPANIIDKECAHTNTTNIFINEIACPCFSFGGDGMEILTHGLNSLIKL